MNDATDAPITSPFLHHTREAWLREAALSLNVLLERYVPDFPLGLTALAVSTGFPKGGRKRIGECWSRGCAADGQTHHVFISPELDDVIAVLATLLHEMVHAAVGTDQKHKGEFVKAARAVGLEKPWTATTPGARLLHELMSIASDLGPYPHVKLTRPTKTTERIKSTVKLVSTMNDEYIISMSRRLVDEFGLPRDPDGEEMIEMDA